jgi:uncharacterized protein (DUF1330 family)
MALYALNLFDLAENDEYRAYSRRSLAAVRKYGGQVVALGKLADEQTPVAGDTEPREVMILVQWPDRAAFDGFLSDPEHRDLHPLREDGTERYLWWCYERIEDLRRVFDRNAGGTGRRGD